MKIVFTGETSTPRETLIQRSIAAGLDVMNSVSSRTSLLVSNRPSSDTRKAELARHHGTPALAEADYLPLLDAVQAGEPKTNESVGPAGPTPRAPQPLPPPLGPLTGHRILIVGGAHDEAIALRTRIAELGGQGAANLTASVTDVVALTNHAADPRWPKITQLGVQLLDPNSLEPSGIPTRTTRVATSVAPAAAVELPEPIVLPRGGVTDLPTEIRTWSLSISWPDQRGSCDVDVVAFVVDADEQVGVDEDFCFYNQPEHPTGAVMLDLGTPSEALVTLIPDDLPNARRRVVISAAIDGDLTFGDLGPIELVLRTNVGQPLVRATLDAATQERSLTLANVYQRNGTWRFRAVGQGYRTSLAALAVMHGVDIEEA
jgi:DNA polymerase-3 subunit epsilon